MNFANEMKIYMKHVCTAAGKKNLFIAISL